MSIPPMSPPTATVCGMAPGTPRSGSTSARLPCRGVYLWNYNEGGGYNTAASKRSRFPPRPTTRTLPPWEAFTLRDGSRHRRLSRGRPSRFPAAGHGRATSDGRSCPTTAAASSRGSRRSASPMPTSRPKSPNPCVWKPTYPRPPIPKLALGQPLRRGEHRLPADCGRCGCHQSSLQRQGRREDGRHRRHSKGPRRPPRPGRDHLPAERRLPGLRHPALGRQRRPAAQHRPAGPVPRRHGSATARPLPRLRQPAQAAGRALHRPRARPALRQRDPQSHRRYRRRQSGRVRRAVHRQQPGRDVRCGDCERRRPGS